MNEKTRKILTWTLAALLVVASIIGGILRANKNKIEEALIPNDTTVVADTIAPIDTVAVADSVAVDTAVVEMAE